jgi:NitT/TauT family transport system permease protein
MAREAAGGAPTHAAYDEHQRSDLAAATGKPYAAAADAVVAQQAGSLGLDMLALLTALLVLVLHHVQNPLLQYGTQFGRAFRNAGLQNALAVALVVCALLLAAAGLKAARRAGRSQTLARGAAGVLAAYAVFIVLAVPLASQPLAPLVGVDPVLFTDELPDDLPVAPFERALGAATAFAGLALAAIVLLWQPWARLSLYGRLARNQIAALAVGVLVLVLWEGLIAVFQIQQFLLPRPSVIGQTFLDTYPRLVSAGWVTFQNAFWGFAIGCGLGVLGGMIAARFVAFSRALLPIAIAINAVPIIALAPIFNNWFGALNPASKIVLVAVLCFFPAMISTVRGLTSVDALSLELMRSYAANSAHTFRKLRFPSALPYIFSALKVATTLAMIGAIVSEYFGGSTAGLGFRIRDDSGLFRYPEAWSAILMASLFGIAFYLVVSAVERAVLSWHVAFREK